jgi:hypothetical protein
MFRNTFRNTFRSMFRSIGGARALLGRSWLALCARADCV